ncbi:MAG: DUF3108 domain-containing protein [Candidatus Avelusimicrobium sp.]|uniref:DUF3108 domain-containing protein n=1 Tax=Candidatus Avelusimicrobium sp. TaxID=3048833 RepID=UPI003F103D59
MTRSAVIVLMGVLLAACAAKSALQQPPLLETASQIQTDTSVPAQVQETAAVPPAISSAAAQETDTLLPQNNQETERISVQTNPTTNSQDTVQERISRARQAQTLAVPQPDRPSFEDEATISLQDRLLSPLVYEPVTTAEKSDPWTGENLKYGIYYSFIRAGTAYIKTRGLTKINKRNAFLIQTTAFSASVIDAFFKVRDVNYSWLDAETFYSLGYSQSVREGNYKRDEWLTFDYDNNLYYGEVRKKESPRVIAGELQDPVLDMLSSLYFVRAQPLTAGKDIVFDIVNRERSYPLLVKVLKKETIKTAAGKFDCIVVEPQFRGEGIFVSKGKSLKVWLTDDQYKMPVKMKAEVFIGSVSAELLEYKRN